MATPHVPDVPGPRRRLLAAFLLCLSFLAVLAMREALPLLLIGLLRLLGIAVVLGIFDTATDNAGLWAAIQPSVRVLWRLYLPVSALSAALASWIVYNIVGEPLSITGAFAPGYAVLTLMYASAGYLALAAATTVLRCIRETRRIIPVLTCLTRAAPDDWQLRITLLTACIALAVYLVPLSVEYAEYTIGTDLQFAENVAESRHGGAMDPAIAEIADYGDIGLAFALSATPRKCRGASLDDRTIVLSARRVVVIPALTRGNEYESSTTWPTERLRVINCVSPRA